VKPLLAILLSVVLVWVQSVLGACPQVASSAADGSGCSCRHCGKTCCCINKKAPRSEPAPAVPAPGVAQSGQLLSLAPASVAFVLPPAASSAFAHLYSSPSRPAAPPLYQQNCTLLI